MNEFTKRTISGILFVAVVTGSLLIGHTTYFIVFLSIMVASLYEFYQLTLKAKIKPQAFLGMLIGTAFFIWSYLYSSGKIEQITVYGFFPIVTAIFIIELYRAHRHPLQNIAATLMGLIYIALPFSLINFIVINGSSFKTTFSSDILLGILFLIWSNDTGAYLFGVGLGKTKMFPRISPKKSWEGFVGGIATTLLAAWGISMFFTSVSLPHWMAIALITSIGGVLGDLVESMFKRSIGVKDSGKFLPGHGGLLDRFDALLLVIPVVYAYLEIMMLL